VDTVLPLALALALSRPNGDDRSLERERCRRWDADRAWGRARTVAFEELYRRFARTVLGLALRRIGDRGRSEDTVQEVFAAVWRSAATYDRAREPGGAWIYTIARNPIVDAQRRRHAPTVADPPETEHIATCAACAAEQASLLKVRSLRDLAR